MSGENRTDKINQTAMMLGIAIWLVMMLFFGLNWGRLPDELPLFYSLPRGEQQLISRLWFLVILLVSGLVFAINLLLAHWLGKEELLLKRFLICGGTLGLTLLLMTVGRIMIIIL